MNKRVKLRFDTSNESILWKSKIKTSFWDLLLYRFSAYSFFAFLIFFIWIFWIGLSYNVFNYKNLGLFILCFIIASALTFPDFYAAFNFKFMYLTRKGLIVKTRFNGELFYPYGSFVMYSNAKTIYTDYHSYGLKRVFTYEEITIFSLKHPKKTFALPKKRPPLKSYIFKGVYSLSDQTDFLGAFENHEEFKKLCTQYTQRALKTMNAKEKEQFLNLCLNVPYNVFEVNFEFYWDDFIDIES